MPQKRMPQKCFDFIVFLQKSAILGIGAPYGGFSKVAGKDSVDWLKRLDERIYLEYDDATTETYV